VKGVHSLGSAGCGKRESWRIGTVVGVEPGLGVVVCGEWTNQWARSPCGLIASARGGLLLRENERHIYDFINVVECMGKSHCFVVIFMGSLPLGFCYMYGVFLEMYLEGKFVVHGDANQHGCYVCYTNCT
jgi:hypothetical protein